MDRVRLCTSHPAKGGRGNYRKQGIGFHSPALPALPWPHAGCKRTLLTILRLSALIWRVWITSFISLQRDLLSTTAAESNTSSPSTGASPGGVSSLADTWTALRGWGRSKRAHPRSTHCGPTSTQTGKPEQERLCKSKNMKGGLLAEDAWSCTSLWTVWLTVPQLGSRSWGCWLPGSKSMKLGRQHMMVFSLCAQCTFFYCS